jgi:hypothetical protein
MPFSFISLFMRLDPGFLVRWIRDRQLAGREKFSFIKHGFVRFRYGIPA